MCKNSYDMTVTYDFLWFKMINNISKSNITDQTTDKIKVIPFPLLGHPVYIKLLSYIHIYIYIFLS